MPDQVQYQKFKTLGCCVIIPTYNNGQTLESVIRGVLEFTDQVIVVNDGSTDSTRQILFKIPGTYLSFILIKTKAKAMQSARVSGKL